MSAVVPSHRARARGLTLACGWALCACTSPDMPPSWNGLDAGGSVAIDSDAGLMQVHEPDLREPKRAAVAPPAIQGGTLLALSDGDHLVVGDPDRHRVLGVTLTDGEVVFETDVGAGSLPGRSAEDGEGRVHVVLRGTGELLTLLPDDGEQVRRMAVCPEPRGIAYDDTLDGLHLACADGTLWTYAAATGEELGKVFVARDLRDVVMGTEGSLWVSTFRSARVFRVGADGEVSVLPTLPDLEQTVSSGDGTTESRAFSARGAWRMVSDQSGGVYVVHQRATHARIDIEPHDEPVPDEHIAETVVTPFESISVQANSYGGGVSEVPQPPGCDSIVHSAVTRISSNGTTSASAAIGGTVLPVDMTPASSGNRIAVVSAGLVDEGTPKAKLVESDGSESEDFCADCIPASTGIRLLHQGDVQFGTLLPIFGGRCVEGSTVPQVREPATAVAALQGTALVAVLVRDPSRLYIVDTGTERVRGRIELGGESVVDTGHDLFHRDSGGGIACASCHLEGAEDGHTWRFSGLGLRRTQPLDVTLRGTEPFHWDGAMEGLGSIMSSVFVGRMGGAPQSAERLDALRDWVLDLRPLAPVRPDDDPAAKRGKALFESKEVGCAQCHSGPKLTNNESVDVGTSDGVALQVPSLLGVAHRLPLMHDGCAASLRQRFDAECGGGDSHGTTSQLSDAEIDDLVAYLETL